MPFEVINITYDVGTVAGRGINVKSDVLISKCLFLALYCDIQLRLQYSKTMHKLKIFNIKIVRKLLKMSL